MAFGKSATDVVADLKAASHNLCPNLCPLLCRHHAVGVLPRVENPPLKTTGERYRMEMKATGDKTVAGVRYIVAVDPGVTQQDTAEEVQGISLGTLSGIVRRKLGYRKLCARCKCSSCSRAGKQEGWD